MPTTPYIVSGTVYTSRGKVPNSTVIINSDIKIQTDSQGKYILDLANLTAGYNSGDNFDIESYDEFNNEYIKSTITVSGVGQTKNLFLDPRLIGQGKATGYSMPTELRNVGNKVITCDNPLDVQNVMRTFTKKLTKLPGTNRVEYIGEASPGTPTSEPRWRIQKLIYDGMFTSEIIWAGGNSEFNKIWNNRTTYNYS